MKNLHAVKCKAPESGWEIKEEKKNGGNRILWAATKKMLLECYKTYLNGHFDPVSLKIHLKKTAKFQEERTSPRSADPKRSKG